MKIQAPQKPGKTSRRRALENTTDWSMKIQAPKNPEKLRDDEL